MLKAIFGLVILPLFIIVLSFLLSLEWRGKNEL